MMIWKDYLAFSKKQKNGFWVLMILILLMIVFIVMPKSSRSGLKIILSNQLSSNIPPDSIQHAIDNSNVLFNFDPNSATIDELKILGFPNSVIINLKKYIKAGGRIYKAHDLLKIYGVDTVLFNRVANHVEIRQSVDSVSDKTRVLYKTSSKRIDFNTITIDEMRAMGFAQSLVDTITSLRQTHWINLKVEPSNFLNATEKYQVDALRSSLFRKKVARKVDVFVMELNSADTSQLVLLPGIGPALSRRIVRYRQKLGGFYAIHQLNEVYGLSPQLTDSLKPYFTIDTLLIKPLNVNTTSITKLKDHPYIGFYKAKDIVEYRQANGSIHNLTDLFHLQSFKVGDWQRIHHYLCK